VELCVKVLSDIMELLFRKDEIGPTVSDVTEVMLMILRTVIQVPISLDKDQPNVVSMSIISFALIKDLYLKKKKSPQHRWVLPLEFRITNFKILVLPSCSLTFV